MAHMVTDCLLSGGLVGPPLPDPHANSDEDFILKLQHVAGLFLELLQESKIKLLHTPLSAISLICDIARFMQGEEDIFLLDTCLDKKEQATQTRLDFRDIELLYAKAQYYKPVQTDVITTEKNCDKSGGDNDVSKQPTRVNDDKNKSVFDEDFFDIEDDEPRVTNGSVQSKTNSNREVEPLKTNQAQEFKCSYCSKVFIDKRNLKSHLWIHEKEKSYECDVCQKKFLRPHQLTRHKRVHTGEKPYKCSVCTRAFGDISNLHVHLRKEHPTEASAKQCDVCGQRCTTVEELKEHAKLHRDEKQEEQTSNQNLGCRTRGSYKKEASESQLPKVQTPKPSKPSRQKGQKAKDTFLCKICGKQLNQRSALLAHMKRHVSQRCYRCEFCNEEFKDLKVLKAHSRKHTGDRPYTCSVCSKCFRSPTTLKSHMITHTGKLPYSCEICSKSFSQTSGLNLHKLTHTAEEEREKGDGDSSQLTCDICGKAYKTKFRLTVHKNSHNSQLDIPCDFCDKKFQSGQDLSIHRRTHTKDKYSCRVCGASFKSRSVYYFHTRTHPSDKPYLCHTCGKSFSRSYDLNAHKRRHTEQGDKQTGPYGCEVCGKVYQMKNSLKIHMKIHQGIFDHPCDFCEKKFKCPAELRHHRRVHTLERPYTCQTCGKSFARHSTLVNHQRTHSGERPYLCIVCGSAFKLSCTLKKHSKVHSREGPVKGKGARTRQPNRSVAPRVPQTTTATTIDTTTPAATPVEETTIALAALLQQPPPQLEPQPQKQQPQLPPLLAQTQPLPTSAQPRQHQILINPQHRGDQTTTSTLLLTPNLKQTVATLIQADGATLLQHLERAGGTLQTQPPPQQQQHQDISELHGLETITLPANILHMREAGSATTLMDLRDTAGLTTVRTFLTTNSDLELREAARTLGTADLETRDHSRNITDLRTSATTNTLQYNPNAAFPSYYYYQ